MNFSGVLLTIALSLGTFESKIQPFAEEPDVIAIFVEPREPAIGWYKQLWTQRQEQEEIELTNEVSEVSPPVPPTPDDSAKMARFIMHYSSWGSLSHISLQPQISGSPLARVYSVSDGPIDNSSGVPYFYMTPNDPEFIDIARDNRASLTLTLAQTPYCRAKAYDPEDPRCAQVILTGKFIILKNTSSEWEVAQNAMFTRHPVMKNWPESHHWVLCKLDIKRILVADNFGGNKYPSVEDYFKAKPGLCSSEKKFIDVLFS